jgi:hypothetical protein
MFFGIHGFKLHYLCDLHKPQKPGRTHLNFCPCCTIRTLFAKTAKNPPTLMSHRSAGARGQSDTTAERAGDKRCGLRHASSAIRDGPCLNVQQPTSNNQRPTSNVQQPTPNNQRPTPTSNTDTDTRHSTLDTQRPTPNIQRPTPNAQHPTSNAQRRNPARDGPSLSLNREEEPRKGRAFPQLES